MHYCEHFKTLVNPKIPSFIKNICYECQQSPPLLWMCLIKACGSYACQNNKYKHMYDHQMQMQITSNNNNISHCVFINTQTAQIRCIECKIQIYDIDQLQGDQFLKYKNSIDPYVFRVRYLPKNNVQQNKLFENLGQFQNSQAHKKSRKGLCGLYQQRNQLLITTTVQFLSNISYYKHILKHLKLQVIKNENTKFLMCLANIIKRIWNGQSKAILVHELTKMFIQRCPKLKGYKRKDPYQLFIFILNIMNQQLKFTEAKVINRELLMIQPLDEWKLQQQLDKSYKQYSIIKEPLLNEIQYTLFCKKCKSGKKVLGQILNMELQIPKIKRETKQLEIQFGKHKYQSPFKKRRRSLIDRLFGSVQQQPPLTLIELIINFMKNKKFLSENIKTCKNCGNQEFEIKESKFNKLPKILLIKIERLLKDGYSLDMRQVDYPQDTLNMKGFVKQKYEQQTIYQFSSAICVNKQKQYIALVKNSKNKQKYQFKNQYVKLSTQKHIPYLLCFTIKNKYSNLYHNIKSNVKLDISPQIPLPQFWLEQLKNFQPMPLVNPKICKHLYLKPRVQSKIHKISYIPSQIYQALIQKFGGRICINSQCQICLKQIFAINLRKKKQKQAITKYDALKTKVNCMISTIWLAKWTQYLYKKKQNSNYSIKPTGLPGAVNNLILLQNQNKCKANLKKGEDFKVINFYVWTFFKQLYGGGPQIQYKSKVQDKKMIQTNEVQIAKQISEKVKQLKQYLTQQFYLKKQWQQSPNKLNKTISNYSESQLFESKQYVDE